VGNIREKMTDEKDLMVGMIVSTKFAQQMVPLIDNIHILQNIHYKLIISECIDYLHKYGKSPMENMNALILGKSERSNDEYGEDLLDVWHVIRPHTEVYLERPESFNIDFYYNKCLHYLKERDLINLAEKISGLVLNDDVDMAESLVKGYKRKEKSLGAGLDMLNNKDLAEILLPNEEDGIKPVIQIPGAFGKAMGDIFYQDIIAVGGASKKGKSWILMNFAEWAVQSNLKVAYFTLEMNEKVAGRRIVQSWAGQTKHDEENVCIPFIKDGILLKKYVKKAGLSQTHIKRQQRVTKRNYKGSGFRVFDTNTGGCTVDGINTTLDNLRDYEDFDVNVIIIDYADILEPEPYGPKDHIASINHTWLQMKRTLAVKRNALVITASQLNRGAIKKDGGIDNIAGNIRKFDHVSHWITLNQSEAEKKNSVMRVRIDGRHDEFVPEDIVLLQSLGIGRPVLDSYRKVDIKNYGSYIGSGNVDPQEKKDD